MQLISESYRKLNESLHAGGRYGRHGDKWADSVRALMDTHSIASVLDYGCGQGALSVALGGSISEYDPAIKEKSAMPAPADLVVCTDVMEHIEPELLDNVIDHLADLSRVYCFMIISTRPAMKFLEDGRNAHLIVQPASWWQERLSRRFGICEWKLGNDEVCALLKPR